MAGTSTPIAPDSSKDLHDLIGEDATATFESDPKFIDANPARGASSENLATLRDMDDTEDDIEDDDIDDDDEYEDAEDEDDEIDDEDEIDDDEDDEEDDDEDDDE